MNSFCRKCLTILVLLFGCDALQAMEVLPPGSVRAEGWLLAELEKQRDGLTGHAEELYDDIGKSDWLTNSGRGGEYAWERGPYYARGLVALAFALNDDGLKAKAKRWVDAALASQRPDGDFGPKRRNWWANMVVLSYLRDWAEATNDGRIVPFIERYFDFQRHEFAAFPLADESCWAKARGGDEADVALWLAAKTCNDKWKKFARDILDTTADWTDYYRFGGDPSHEAGYRSHIVNFMQGLKTPALRYALTGAKEDFDACAAAFSPEGWGMRTCGRPDAMLNGSEPLTDRSASGGTELCAIAERIISLKSLIALSELAAMADDLEDVVYNSLPATIGRDGRGIRYYLLLNQPACIDKGLLFANNGFGSQVTGAICAGPHSGFGCCRSNWHVALPRFTELMWMRRGNGLALVAHGPSCVTATVGGSRIVMREETEYPYSGKVKIRVIDGGGEFPLFVRIPRWAKLPDAGAFRLVEREWKKGDVVELDFPMETTLSFWDRDAVCVRRGPLIYAMEVEGDEAEVTDYVVPYENRKPGAEADGFPRREIRPIMPWNYALALTKDRKLIKADVVGTGCEQKILVCAYRTDAQGWGKMRPDAPGRAVDPPWSPVEPVTCYFPQTVALVPLAKTQTRITLFPWCESGYWCYRPNVCETWQLRQLRDEADRGILHFGYPGEFMRLENEPTAQFSPVKIPKCECIVGFPGHPPHRIDRPSWSVPIVRNGDVYDVGRLEIGHVRVEAERCPRLFVGESIAEAMSTDTNGFEQSTQMVTDGKGRWRSEIPLALRYLRFADEVGNVAFDTQIDWREAAGAYSCTNLRYEKIWRIGRDTLRRCNRTFFVDAIKRDRLPWAADLVVSMISQAYTFGDPEPIKRHLAAIASADPERGQVNGVIAFSMWWVVGHDVFQRYFGDMDYLRIHYPRIRARMRELEGHEDERGFLVYNLGWDFMDWTDSAGGELKSEISRQAIYYWALSSARRLAERMGDVSSAGRWAERADRLKAAVSVAGMDGTRQSRILSILSGLAEGDIARRLAHELATDDLPPTVTPYMATYEVMALAAGGQVAAAVRRFESVWGAMADADVDAYWEGWDAAQTGADRYRYYDRPFGKSLCHSWSSGPAFLIPGVFLGVRPTSDGWRTYEAKPIVGEFAKGARVVVPTASGFVRVDFKGMESR